MGKNTILLYNTFIKVGNVYAYASNSIRKHPYLEANQIITLNKHVTHADITYWWKRAY